MAKGSGLGTWGLGGSRGGSRGDDFFGAQGVKIFLTATVINFISPQPPKSRTNVNLFPLSDRLKMADLPAEIRFPENTNPRLELTRMNIGSFKATLRTLLNEIGNEPFLFVPLSHVGECPSVTVWKVLYEGRHPSVKLILYEDGLGAELENITFELFQEDNENAFMPIGLCLACERFVPERQ